MTKLRKEKKFLYASCILSFKTLITPSAVSNAVKKSENNSSPVICTGVKIWSLTLRKNINCER